MKEDKRWYNHRWEEKKKVDDKKEKEKSIHYTPKETIGLPALASIPTRI